MPLQLRQAESQVDWQHARALVEEYAASLNVDLAFQDFNAELADLEREYGPPTGALLLAMGGDEYIGCVALRRWSSTVGEIKRLYVRPSARGVGAGRQLVTQILSLARDMGYARVMLDTLPSMSEARALYLSLGFTPIEPYRFNPVAGTSYLAFDLTPL